MINCFQDALFVFQSLIINLAVGLFVSILPGVHLVSCMLTFMFFIKFGKISAIISFNTFSDSFFSLLLKLAQGFWLAHLMVTHGSLRSCSFYFDFFVLFLKLDNFYCLHFKWTDSFACFNLIWLWISFLIFFSIFIIIVFSSRISFWSLNLFHILNFVDIVHISFPRHLSLVL